MILTILHAAQWSLVGVCLPLFGLLLYALGKEWIKAELKQRYDAGFKDGYDAALTYEEKT